MAFGKAIKKQLNKQVKLAKKVEEIKAREQFIAEMDDDKTYYNEKYKLNLTGKEWKELIL